MSRKHKQEIVCHLTDIRNRIDRLGHNVDHRRYDVLNNYDLQLLIALYRKGKGCASLARFAVVEITEAELIAATHAGHGFDLQPFDEERLSLIEQNKLGELQNHVIAGTEM